MARLEYHTCPIVYASVLQRCLYNQLKLVDAISFFRGKITPFVGKQVEIAKAFGLDIPVGCEPGYKSKKVGRKRGRPKKNES